MSQLEDFVNQERYRKIKLSLIAQDKKFIEIANQEKVTPGCINNVAKGHYFVWRIARALARETNIPFEKLWPERASKPSNPEIA